MSNKRRVAGLGVRRLGGGTHPAVHRVIRVGRLFLDELLKFTETRVLLVVLDSRA